MNGALTTETKKKAAPTVGWALGRHPAPAQTWDDGVLSQDSSSPDAIAQTDPVSGHDFSRISVHPPGSAADAQALQPATESCPLALASPRACPFGGACHTCPTRVQAKLAISQPGDEYEQEADRVAEQVMRMPEPYLQRQAEPEEDKEEETLQAKPLASQITPLVQRQEEPEEEEEEPVQAKLMDGGTLQRQGGQPEEEEEEPVQTKAVNGTMPVVTPRVQAGIEALRGGGQPLPTSERAFFEPRFGYDFSQVRVHTGGAAAEVTRVINARAFAVGRDVVMGAGQYALATEVGRRLLAHELCHVVQQVHSKGDLRQIIHRQPGDRPENRHDVAFVLEKNLEQDAKLIAPQAEIIVTKNPIDFALELKKIKSPIRTFIIFGHSIPSGGFRFEKSLGLIDRYVTPDAMVRLVKGNLPPKVSPESIDFRSCTIGQKPKVLERYRTAFGAKEAFGLTCSLAIEESGPIVINNVKITSRSQLNDTNRKEFVDQLKELPKRIRRKKCILGTSEQDYFKAKGNIISVYGLVMPGKKPGPCYSNLPIETMGPEKPGSIMGCKIVRVIGPSKQGKSEKGQ